jgi:peptidoglycan/xylan/chitin deacetylase (PgdA/CDA1 family)
MAQFKESAMHSISLSFDDGIMPSAIRTAEIYEHFGLRACLNVLAAPEHLVEAQKHWGGDRGDFALWNELQARGHEIMPHGYNHTNKGEIPFEQAKASILRCLDIFEEKLNGFDRRDAVFNFPHNNSTSELEAWLPTQVRAFRTSGGGINPLPHPSMVRLTTTGFGPENCEEHLDQQIEALLSQPEGWLIYNTHALDHQGWGPIRASYLESLLDRLLEIPTVRILPTAAVLLSS